MLSYPPLIFRPEGDFLNEIVVRFTMSRQYQSISRGSNSLLGALRNRFPDVGVSNLGDPNALPTHKILEHCKFT